MINRLPLFKVNVNRNNVSATIKNLVIIGAFR